MLAHAPVRKSRAVTADVSRLLAVDYDLVSQSGGASARGGVPLTFFQGVNLGRALGCLLLSLWWFETVLPHCLL
jgi:hypothetical protein